MNLITLPLPWVTIRIDVFPVARMRAQRIAATTSPSVLKASLETRLCAHLFRDVGGDASRRD